MTTKLMPGGEGRIDSLLDEIAAIHGQEAALATKAEVAGMEHAGAVLLLNLVCRGAWGTDAEAVQALLGLGYSDIGQVMAVSRLISGDWQRLVVPTILSLGLPQARSRDLLDITPEGCALISPSDDRSWQRALLSLPKEDFRTFIQQAGSPGQLWTLVVSAHDPAMRRRIQEFTGAGFPYVAWMLSGHSLEALEGAAPLARNGAKLSRAEVNGAVRALDRKGVDDGSEQA